MIHYVKSVQIRIFFWSVFSHIRTKWGEIRSISSYLVRIDKIRTRKSSVFGHFSRSDWHSPQWSSGTYWGLCQSLREKCANTEFFLVRIFLHSDWIRRDTDYLSVSSPNAGKEGPEKTPCLDTFYALIGIKLSVRYYVVLFCRILFSSCYLEYHCPIVRFFSCLSYWCYGRLSNCSPIS